MSRKSSRRPNPFRLIVLFLLVGAFIYVDRFVVPTIPPLFVPTPTATRPPESYVTNAEELVKEGKLSQAIQAYKDAVLVDPKNPSSWISLARLQIYTNDYEAALESASNALLINPNNSMALAVRGWAYSFLENYTDAEKSLKSALEIDPSNAAAYAYLSEVYLNIVNSGLGQLSTMDDAIAASKTAQSLSPNSLETHRARGLILENTSNYEEAVTEFEAAVAINDNIADLHLALGRNYRAIAEYDNAITEFSKANALNPKDSLPETYISRTYFMNGDYTKAVQYAEAAVKDAPTDPYMYGNLGLIYWKIGQYQDTVDMIKLAIKGGVAPTGETVSGLPLDSGRIGEYYYTYGLALSKLGQCGEALQISQAVSTSLRTDDVAQYNAAEIITICEQAAKAGTIVTPTPEGTQFNLNPNPTPLGSLTPEFEATPTP